MLKPIFDYFYFSQKERRGIILMLTLIFILILSNIGIKFYTPNSNPANAELFFKWTDSLYQQSDSKKTFQQIKYFNFDPNILDSIGWGKMGFKAYQIKMILKYRKAGGLFFKKEDFKKIYFVNDSLFEQLAPYIKISAKQKSKVVPKTKHQTRLKINQCDSAALTKIRGIGPVLARRIISYKILLGGYTSIEQLNEVYGIDKQKFESIKSKFVLCDSSQIRKLNINKSGFKELLKHPYISYDFVKIIVNERRKEAYTGIEDFKVRTQLPDSIYLRLRSYLMIE